MISLSNLWVILETCYGYNILIYCNLFTRKQNNSNFCLTLNCTMQEELALDTSLRVRHNVEAAAQFPVCIHVLQCEY